MSERRSDTDSAFDIFKRVAVIGLGFGILAGIGIAMNWQRLHPPEVAVATQPLSQDGEVEGVITTSGRLPSGHQAVQQSATSGADLQPSPVFADSNPVIYANTVNNSHTNTNDEVVSIPEVPQPTPPTEVVVVPEVPTPPVIPPVIPPTTPTDPVPPVVPAITITGTHADAATLALVAGTTTSYTFATSDGSSVDWTPFYKNIIWSGGVNDSPTALYWTVLPVAATPGKMTGSQMTFQVQVSALALPSALEETAFVVTDATRNISMIATLKFSIVPAVLPVPVL